MENPEYVLKCPNRVTSFCAIFKETNGFFVTGQVDGLIFLVFILKLRGTWFLLNALLCRVLVYSVIKY